MFSDDIDPKDQNHKYITESGLDSPPLISPESNLFGAKRSENRVSFPVWVTVCFLSLT